ncbi:MULTISPECIES: hypothetical protein [Rhizobium/Agrobacterium group]|jgi:hypothetical protein|uniref:hypothetical protein n=1 Tax=Rhizobium/Agrobacterium group TaxID=227290 RepID=UPI0011EFA34F|nr:MULTISPECIES: hypothetical protein [Rhizobium/Agrobacterium group]MDH0117574.1 hypothetical protein [Agrobacterium pusense]TZG31494.1 hypothetical protein AGR1_28225 [Agrobacterium sp. B1(2019)]
MSELQNRIVERLGALDPLRQVALTPDKRERLMTAAIGLFYAAGGDADDLKEIVLKADDRNRRDVADAVAQMVVATAAVSYASNLALVQAAYNWIDNTPVSLSD